MSRSVCNHPKWDIDWNTCLPSNPPQFRGACTKCGHTESRRSGDWVGENCVSVSDNLTGFHGITTDSDGNLQFTGTVKIGPEPTWFENNETPPVGAECEISVGGGPFMTCTVDFVGSNLCVVSYDLILEKAYRLTEVKFRPVQPKVVNMTKFAGTGFLMRSRRKHECFIAKQNNTDYIQDEDARPVYNHPNSITGLTEEPEWLEGFEYFVTVGSFDEKLDFYTSEISWLGHFQWGRVVAVTITGLKDGWVYD